MNFSTVKKVIFLLIVVGIVFNSIFFLIYQTLAKMQTNIDLVYYVVYKKILMLKDLNNLLGYEVQKIVVDYDKGKAEKEEAINRLIITKDSIEELWQDYRNEYRVKLAMDNKDTANSCIEASKHNIDNIIKKITNDGTLSIPELYMEFYKVKNEVREMSKAQIENGVGIKKKMDTYFDRTVHFIIVLLVLSFAFIILISYLVVKSIKKNEQALKQAQIDLEETNKELHKNSITDGLTQLYNRRYFDIVFQKFYRRSLRSKIPIGIIILDIDYYKKYNDTYGHVKGDYVLKEISLKLTQLVKRADDYIFRLGGEEFCMLCFDCNTEALKKLSTKILEGIYELKIEHRASDVSPYVTVSLGFLSIVVQKDMSIEQILTTVDRALYNAKEEGRNRYAYYENLIETQTQN
ncbi:MAG: GGDEF domain-containing protein [Helicobacteraceae bacterium]